MSRKVRRLPRIVFSKRQQRDITRDALIAIRGANQPPKVFQRGGTLTRLVVVDSVPKLEAFTDHSLKGYVAQIADWFRISWNKPVPAPPPPWVAQDILTRGEWEGIPQLDRIIEAPTFTREGSIIVKPGYHPDARLLYQPAGGLSVQPPAASPHYAEVREARKLIEELLCDFPFPDASAKAHAIAAMLLPFVRELIDGLTPLHLIDAPSPGTGKGLLAGVIAIPAIGRGPAAMTEGRSEEEWRKRITALLIQGGAYVLIDNIRARLDSGALAAALTATPAWEDRILGKSQIVTLPVRCVWLATGNNVQMSTEISRRTVRIRLDASVENPWTRPPGGFTHSLPGWALANRPRLIWACLTLIQGWLAAGRPKGERSLGRFEPWAEVIGGILQFAEVDAFLADSTKFYDAADEETQPWREFITGWWELYKGKPVVVEDLWMYIDSDLLRLPVVCSVTAALGRSTPSSAWN